jgi:hypothetical protein
LDLSSLFRSSSKTSGLLISSGVVAVKQANFVGLLVVSLRMDKEMKMCHQVTHSPHPAYEKSKVFKQIPERI